MDHILCASHAPNARGESHYCWRCDQRPVRVLPTNKTSYCLHQKEKEALEKAAGGFNGKCMLGWTWRSRSNSQRASQRISREQQLCCFGYIKAGEAEAEAYRALEGQQKKKREVCRRGGRAPQTGMDDQMR